VENMQKKIKGNEKMTTIHFNGILEDFGIKWIPFSRMMHIMNAVGRTMMRQNAQGISGE
jgi:hypothetical protein